MTLVNIPGMTEDSILNTNTNPTGAGFRPFPCNADGWTRHTAHVIKAEVKTFEQSGDDVLSIVVANVQYGGEITINLDPSKVGPKCADPEKQRQRNLESLVKAIKILGAHTNGKLDTNKLNNARNQIVEVSAIHQGFREKDGKYYHKVKVLLNGEAKEEVNVTEVTMPALPGSTPAPAASTDEQDPFFL